MSAPVRHTCPKIDDIIKDMHDSYNNLNSALNYIDNYEFDQAIYDIKEVRNIIDKYCGKYSELENLRDDNTSLRDWGHNLENKVEDLEQEIEKLMHDLEDFYE